MKLKYALMTATVMAMGASAFAATSTADFVKNVAISNEFEIDTSKVALSHASDAHVKSFAQQMIDDHTKAGKDFKKALKKSDTHAKPPAALDDDHQAKLDELKQLNGADFDQKYIAVQDDAHKEAVSLFSDYSANGDDPSLKQFATNTLPTLKGHLKHVERLKSSMQ